MLIAILIGAMLGYMIGRLPGLLIGAVLGGWIARRFVRGVVVKRLAQLQTQFLDSTFAVMGCLCKADGQVSDDELQVAEALFQRLHLSSQQQERARAAFERGRREDFDLDTELATVRRIAGSQRALLQVFLQVQLSAIAADGVLHPAEHDMLMRIARGLGCSEEEIAQIEAMLRGSTSEGRQASSGQSLQDAYSVLGVDPESSDAEIKRAYRRLMSENHPDKLAGKGLPESMREMAEERTREISNAYDVIKEARAAEA
ncbi:co-chaperone DjlA [Aidingimonas halophila]|uniref:Co-chaperone protein DjlA n=1 Tax=Aidingimonas halophila TaxID=574349 RepID=A0A1H2XYV7_9GAMM|nr:co-chaperone DjlA [Aidingimonas halophila]GHC29460.1 co-chaperone protein DjlA [Aidingimonas halophila]SDW98010.1 DnaJ like chaperone protein [Aidingimonas halophila]